MHPGPAMCCLLPTVHRACQPLRCAHRICPIQTSWRQGSAKAQLPYQPHHKAPEGLKLPCGALSYVCKICFLHGEAGSSMA